MGNIGQIWATFGQIPSRHIFGAQIIIIIIISIVIIIVITIVIILTIIVIITKIKLKNLNLKEETWWRRESVRAGIVCGENLGKKVSLFLSPTDQVAADDQHAQQVLEKGGERKT